MNSGIYCIKCLENNKVYIGKSTNLSRRKSQHLWMLRHNSHSNPALQSDYNNLGEELFKFIVLQIADENLSELEEKYITEYNSTNSLFGYNEFFGSKPSKKVSMKRSKALIGKSPSKETRNKISRSLLGSNSPRAKKVMCVETGEIFDCVRDIKRTLGLPNGSISKCCRGLQETCGGFHWKYI